MFMEGDKVTYTGPNYTQEHTRRAVCVSNPYDIQGHTMINVEFDRDQPKHRSKFNDDFHWHVVNVKNLEHRTY